MNFKAFRDFLITIVVYTTIVVTLIRHSALTSVETGINQQLYENRNP